MSDLVDRECSVARLRMYAPVGIACAVLLVEIRTEIALGDVHHREAGRDRLIRRAVDGQVRRVQFVVEARQRALVCRHAGFRFEGHQHAADRGALQRRQPREGVALAVEQIDAVVEPHAGEIAIRRPCFGAGWRAQNQIEVLLPVVHEVAHFVIDAEADTSVFHVTAEQGTRPEEIEDDRPARHLRVVITARQILPSIAPAILALGFGKGSDENPRTVHHVPTIATRVSREPRFSESVAEVDDVRREAPNRRRPRSRGAFSKRGAAGSWGRAGRAQPGLGRGGVGT
ncbi:hypothetical protein [Rhodoplanes azumiensis]|uniref:Uncharacterized protein n=1 Tax=Rhodoplanes azumiensis TaxID=1897628 RepID=A0ABW5AEM3_9BRAD